MPNTFLEYEDYLNQIREKDLDAIIQGNRTILDNNELVAITVIKDYLIDRYDTEAIFSNTGNDRYLQVVRWVSCIALYYTYERIPDANIPDRIIKNYDDTLDFLHQVAKGKIAIDLPHKLGSNQLPITKFRYGSTPKREN